LIKLVAKSSTERRFVAVAPPPSYVLSRMKRLSTAAVVADTTCSAGIALASVPPAKTASEKVRAQSVRSGNADPLR
jgi:hypothetical protein